tara:strand:- start:4399 stop:5244 length:846 start_codon:yes stop_codon:yes gene_type:complete
MAWVIVKDGAVVREFIRPTAFTYEGFQYPRNWIRNATDAEKSAIGLVEVTISGNPKDSEYYDNILSANKVESDGSVTRTWSSTAKTLSDLQTIKILSAKENANSALKPTDWYVIRKTEVGTAFSDEISAYRTAVRTCYGNLKTAINAASDIDELAAVYGSSKGASEEAKTIDPSSAVNTTSNTITSNGHGFVDDELVSYDAGMTDEKENTVIGGLSNGSYYVFGKTVNTFKLSESHSSCGDAAAVSLSSGATGTNHIFRSQGIPGKGQVWPNPEMSKYDGA